MSLRTKIIFLIVFLSFIFGLVFLSYALSVNKDSRQLHLDNVTKSLMYESEKVNKAIGIMEQNALDLAVIGRSCYLNRKTIDDAVGAQLVLDNFRKLPEAVGGGIWFERYVFNPDRNRYCFYACYDDDKNLAINEDFDGEDYDYPTQSWYVQIQKHLKNCNRVSWSEIYFDDLGTESLMATVGAGIYDKNDKFVGMSTVDWRIQEVFDRLCSLRPTPNSFVILVDPQYNRIVADTSDETHGGVKDHVKRRIAERNHKKRGIEELQWYPKVPKLANSQITLSKTDINKENHLVFGRVLDNGMNVLILVPEKELTAFLDFRNRVALAGILFFVIVSLAFSLFFVTTRVTRPLKRLVFSVKELGQGKLDTVLEVRGSDEIAQLSSTFNGMTANLKNHIENLKKITADKEKIESELKVAQEIQNGILPKILPPFPKCDYFELDALLYPAREVGGDLYDFFLISPTKLCLVIGDVSGKGVPASLFMAVTQTLHRGLAHENNPDPQSLVVKMNQALCNNNGAELFVTYFFAVLDLQSGLMTYCNAGHNSFYVLKKNGEIIKPAKRHGVPLGMYDDQNYGKSDLQLKKDDLLFFYTDGITEAKNKDGKFFGDAALEKTLKECAEKGLVPKETDQYVLDAVSRFVNGAEQFDDITVLALKMTALAQTSEKN